jgi:hypothetical protein
MNPYVNTLTEKLEVANVMFAYGLGKVTHMDKCPDGNLFILSKYLDTPTIFRISSVNGTKKHMATYLSIVNTMICLI